MGHRDHGPLSPQTEARGVRLPWAGQQEEELGLPASAGDNRSVSWQGKPLTQARQCLQVWGTPEPSEERSYSRAWHVGCRREPHSPAQAVLQQPRARQQGLQHPPLQPRDRGGRARGEPPAARAPSMAPSLPSREASWLALPPPAPHRLARANDETAPLQATGSVFTGRLAKIWHVKKKTNPKPPEQTTASNGSHGTATDGAVAIGRARCSPGAILQHQLQVPGGCTAPEGRWGWGRDAGQGMAPAVLWSAAAFAPARPLSCPITAGSQLSLGAPGGDGSDPAHSSAPPPCPAQGAHGFFTFLMEEELEADSLRFLCSKRETGNKRKTRVSGWERSGHTENTTACPGAGHRAPASHPAVPNGPRCHLPS